MMTCQTSTDIVTYRYNDKLVYVPVAPNYTQALSHVREAFPQLKKLRDASLSLLLTAPGQAQQFVGISASAWPMLIAHMVRYQIIEVHVTQLRSEGERERGCGRDTAPAPAPVPIPNITITYADAEPAPPYRRLDDVDDEKALCPGSIHPEKRNWFFQKLHGNVSNCNAS